MESKTSSLGIKLENNDNLPWLGLAAAGVTSALVPKVVQFLRIEDTVSALRKEYDRAIEVASMESVTCADDVFRLLSDYGPLKRVARASPAVVSETVCELAATHRAFVLALVRWEGGDAIGIVNFGDEETGYSVDPQKAVYAKTTTQNEIVEFINGTSEKTCNCAYFFVAPPRPPFMAIGSKYP